MKHEPLAPPCAERLAAYRADWKDEIARMRSRIEKERTPSGKNDLAIKTGAGGLVDAEFIAQTLCLAHGWQEPNTLRALLLARHQNALPGVAADSLIENYRQLLRIEGILRRWSFAGEAVLPDDPAPLYREYVLMVAINSGMEGSALTSSPAIDVGGFLPRITSDDLGLARISSD